MLHVNLLLTLLLAHLLADFTLQTDLIYRLKSRHWLGIVLHSMIHILVTAALLQGWTYVWPFLLVLGILHFTCDWVKLRYFVQRGATVFLLDQSVHIVVLVGVAFVMPTTTTILPMWVLYPTLTFAFIPAVRIYRLSFGERIVEPKTA